MANPLVRKTLSIAAILAVGAMLGGMVPMVGRGFAANPVDSAPESPAAEVASVCDTAVYPWLPAECLRSGDGSPVPEVRWITEETRLGDNASALTTRPVLN